MSSTQDIAHTSEFPEELSHLSIPGHHHREPASDFVHEGNTLPMPQAPNSPDPTLPSVTNAFRVQRNTTRGAPDRPRTHDPRPGPPPRPRRLDIHPGRTQVQRTFRFRKRRVRPSSALDLSYPHQLGIVD